MKLYLFCTLALACTLSAQQRPARKTAPSAKASAAKAPAAVSIPAGAREVEPGVFRHTDSQGRKWLYRSTPFGMSRWEDKPTAADAAKSEAEQITSAAEDGDYVRFERPGPFGPYRWRQKKSDLSEAEKAAWERRAGKQPPVDQAGKKE